MSMREQEGERIKKRRMKRKKEIYYDGIQRQKKQSINKRIKK